MDSLQDQISELKRQFETLEARERTLEYLSMNRGED
jgi:cell division protein FtsB